MTNRYGCIMFEDQEYERLAHSLSPSHYDNVFPCNLYTGAQQDFNTALRGCRE
ncbi:hypothetical protein SDC9_190042 [bioreactor metagenome]|uniref:Uncharacterized protein n=1 Tax=bioreactor metagenome TaxID=1076179 RepID=A0A645HTV0_9ZZZZ